MTEMVSPRYFAASNSCQGFRNYYGDIFTDSRTDRLYIIKGGPGTGKSHFMKVVARRARARGYRITEYACSSDPASLDGIILEREGSPTLGFLDGTAPHTREPTLPGVKEELLNLGAFWDGRRLEADGDRIRALAEGKSAAYGRAYAYLAACGAVDRAAESRMADCVRRERIHALANRLLREIPSEKEFSPLPCLRRALGMTGKVCLHTWEREATEAGGVVVILEDYYGLAYHLTRELFARSRIANHSLHVSYDPLYPHKIDGLYYPSNGLCILVGHAEPPENAVIRRISLRRCADPEALRLVRGELRRAAAFREELTEAALRELTEAAEYHFGLEQIYTEAMDFTAKEAFTENFCHRLFDE